ncbi:MAG TPA: DEAD/DEAH box helicase, partial [Thermomicrobiales bacterium]|nr:DEAD/DEAH box helicase [Thermomicrobiales bacterium]
MIDTGTDLVESALEALRREWRAGFNGRMVRTLAMAHVRRLHDRAETQQASDALTEIETQLRTYQTLPIEQRKQALTEVAAALNALRPHLRSGQAKSRPVGTLPSAIAPERARSRQRLPSPDERKNGAEPPVKALSPDAPVTELPRVGKAVAEKLGNLGVATVEDLLKLNPRKHIDYSRTVKIGSILGFAPRDEVTVRGEVIEVREVKGAGKPRVVLRLADETGWIRVTFFNTYIAKQLRVGDEIAVSGVLDLGYGTPSFTSPEWEPVGGPALNTGRLTPVYPLTKGLHQKTLRNLTRAALDATRATIEDYLPVTIREANRLLPLARAYAGLHYPERYADLEAAQHRLMFDSLFLLQLGLVTRKRERQTTGGPPLRVDHDLVMRFVDGLPFRLTDSQQRVLHEILTDLKQPRPMARLLQGDVGSGKTVVAAAAGLVAVASGYQVAVMAPTEILAEQHYHNFRGLYSQLDEAVRPRVALLTGSAPAAPRRETQQGIADGTIDVLVGTHALIQSGVEFQRLGLAVVDEQHRFGVRQRSELSEKSEEVQPHVLSMTATPIPRTLNMVLNGDVDVSIINELPPGRMPVDTRRYFGADRQLAYQLVREEVSAGRQVFVICPLVEESDVIEAKAAVAEADRLKREVFPDYEIATLHGRMSGREKDAIMTAFRDGEYDILVSTSVIEVGIDVL